MPHHFEVDLGAMRQAHPIDGDGEDAAFVDGASGEYASGAAMGRSGGGNLQTKTAPSP